MANSIDITVESPENLLNASMYGANAIVRLQSGATETGSFANEATAALIAGTRVYTVYDTDGTSSTWYRLRYENAGGTTLSDWGAPFQVGDETAGQLCSIYDAKQRLFPPGSTATDEDENILEFIRQASAFLERETGRWFAPRPLSGTTTYTVHTDWGLRLWMPKGIRSITTLGIASTYQPESGGTYTTASAADYYLEPVSLERSPGWPATSICLVPTGSSRFYPATFGAQITGAFGFASVPYDVQSAALDLVVAMHQGRGSGGVGGSFTINVDGSRTFERLPDSVRRVISFYRTPNIG